MGGGNVGTAPARREFRVEASRSLEKLGEAWRSLEKLGEALRYSQASPSFSELIPTSPSFSQLLPASPSFSQLLPASPSFHPASLRAMELPIPRLHLPRVQPGSDPFDTFIGDGPAARAIRAFGRKAAAVDAAVLLGGENGTGKSILGRAIHQASRRAQAPLVNVNCAGVPDSLFESEFFGHVRGAFTGALQTHRGLIEQADRGTLFLDEIGELPLAVQAKLLTVLEDREVRRVGAERAQRVDFRLISASSAELERIVGEGRFRRDLYHRVRVLHFVLAPLRQRRDDLALLVEHFIAQIITRYQRPTPRVSPEAFDLLLAHSWPGNLRELAHAVEAALVECDGNELQPRHFRLSSGLSSPSPLANGLRYSFLGSPEEERSRISEALRICHGNKTLAARQLGMSRNTLLNKLKRGDLN